MINVYRGRDNKRLQDWYGTFSEFTHEGSGTVNSMVQPIHLVAIYTFHLLTEDKIIFIYTLYDGTEIKNLSYSYYFS